MNGQMRDIANRRAKLAMLASFERGAIGDSPLWRSGAFIAIELALASARILGAGYWISGILRKRSADA
jgi:hypothetical protein